MLNTIFIHKKGSGCADSFIGNGGELFYDPERIEHGLRLSDGVTPGGIPLTNSGSSLPVGSIIVSHKDATIDGFIKLDGTSYSPEQYPQLVTAGYPVTQSLLGGKECNYASDDVGNVIWGMQYRILRRSQGNAIWMGWADGGQTLIEWDNSIIEQSGASFDLSAYNMEIGYVDQNMSAYGTTSIRWALELVDKTTGDVTTIDERSINVTELKSNTEYEFVLPTPVAISNCRIRIRTLSNMTYCCLNQVRFFTGGVLGDVLKLPEGRSGVFTMAAPQNGVYGTGLSDDYQAFIRV